MASLEVKLLACGFRESCHFRLNFFVSLAEKLIRLVVLYYFYRAVLPAGPLQDSTVTYIVFATLVEAFIQTNLLDLLARKVETGESVYWTHRPGFLFHHLFLFCTGRKLPALGISLVLIAGLAITTGQAASSLPASLLVLTLAYLLLFEIQCLLGLLVFRLINSWGIRLLHRALFLVLSGVMIPPALMPAGLETICHWLPWRVTVASPVECLLGEPASGILPLQLFWLILLSGLIVQGWKRVRHDAAAVGG